jgi:hypothetical protein
LHPRALLFPTLVSVDFDGSLKACGDEDLHSSPWREKKQRRSPRHPGTPGSQLPSKAQIIPILNMS